MLQITIHDGAAVATRFLQPGEDAGLFPEVAAEAYPENAGVLLRLLQNAGEGFVARAVVDKYQFIVDMIV